MDFSILSCNTNCEGIFIRKTSPITVLPTVLSISSIVLFFICNISLTNMLVGETKISVSPIIISLLKRVPVPVTVVFATLNVPVNFVC